MTYAPATLIELRTYLLAHTGITNVNSLGIVGDAAHRARPSYHNGQDAITQYHRTGVNDYTIRTPRDREPYLTNAASAIDIGNHTRLRAMSKSLVAQCRAGAGGTLDIREIVYSPDGIRVLRWDRERGQTSLPRAEDGLDLSHRFHTHVSWYRDSEHRSKLAPFRRFYQPIRWGSDVTADITGAYAASTVAAKLRALGGTAASFGEAINMTDLEAGLRARGMTWGTRVNLIDVQALMRPGTD